SCPNAKVVKINSGRTFFMVSQNLPLLIQSTPVAGPTCACIYIVYIHTHT
ncbi:uncharacterized protein METZ01_LOCUS231676, partial [marine metagenome]